MHSAIRQNSIRADAKTGPSSGKYVRALFATLQSAAVRPVKVPPLQPSQPSPAQQRSDTHQFCFQVKGLSDGGVDGVNRTSRDGARPSSRPWSPPPDTSAIKRDRDSLVEPLGPRATSPKPSGRIAAAMPDSQLPPSSMPPPAIFSAPYSRPDPSNLLYQRFGFNRPESSAMKPSSTSALSFPGPGNGGHVPRGKGDGLPSPGARESSAHYAKFSPARGEREREDYEVTAARGKEFEVTKSPGTEVERDRSPHASLQRPSSSDQFDLKPRQMTSDSTTEGKGGSPGGPRPRYSDTDEAERGARPRSQDHVKAERVSSPAQERGRTFSGDFTRDSISRLSQNSAGSRPDSLLGPAAAQGNTRHINMISQQLDGNCRNVSHATK